MDVKRKPKKKAVAPAATVPDELDRIKKLVVIAMFSDDELMEQLVLKGGNALDLVHRVSTRASMDIDFSMARDFPGGAAALFARIERALRSTFQPEGLVVFDVTFEERPRSVSVDLEHFWGGYSVNFKLIDQARYDQLAGNLDAQRREALRIGTAGKFEIDISRYEFTEGKQRRSLEGYQVFVYSLEMIVFEKLRAICQQLPEYGVTIRRGRPGSSRARDFVDIWALCEHCTVDLFSSASLELLVQIFNAKQVPLAFLKRLEQQRDYHRDSFRAVRDTVRPEFPLSESFDVYFDYVLGLAGRLSEALGDV
ncbi:MAG: nucleotidyl transferase AbiEii/AbiGii toxin family protein [Burkholderiales bacterium]|jgi:predicted nucleotidyltransferase component of viral defense system|nr:nucleotidyl transferase AbiEii/AbiGii toxin family protein [Burkholderiales bacterium]